MVAAASPAGAAPIRLLLLTTLSADTPNDCRRIVEYYARRWRIEDRHRILKSGCKVEELANRTADRLALADAVLVVARIGGHIRRARGPPPGTQGHVARRHHPRRNVPRLSPRNGESIMNDLAQIHSPVYVMGHG